MFLRSLSRVGCALALSLGVAAITGCANSSESASKDELTKDVGMYPPGPSGVNQPRVGVPAFAVQTGQGFGGGNEAEVDALAADQMTTLLDQTGRFKVIERNQLKKLLDEQSLEGIVTPGELAKQGKVRGVDYLLLGKVTNLRVKKEQTGHEFSLANVGGIFGGADVNNKGTKITTDCGVDIRLVNPTTGEVEASNFSEYKKTDSASAMGLAILGASAQSNADIELSDDDKGKILRLALDDALRKTLPKIDKFLRNQPPMSSDAMPAMPMGGSGAAPSSVTGAANAVAGAKFCPECGTKNAADAKFCAKCGHKFE